MECVLHVIMYYNAPIHVLHHTFVYGEYLYFTMYIRPAKGAYEPCTQALGASTVDIVTESRSMHSYSCTRKYACVARFPKLMSTCDL